MALQLGLTGDVMLGRLVDEVQQHRHYRAIWGDVRERLEALDGLLINLECCLSTRGRKWRRTNRPFHFRADPDWAIPALKGVGVSCCALANNHALDYEESALLDTIDHLDEAGIARAGAGETREEAFAPATFTLGRTAEADDGAPTEQADRADRSGEADRSDRPSEAGRPDRSEERDRSGETDGRRMTDGGERRTDDSERPAGGSERATVAVVAVTDNTPEYAAAEYSPGTAYVPIDVDDPEVRSTVQAALGRARAREPDLLIASLHWGPNMETEPPEAFRRFGRWLVDQGVDLVHGHSAHVVQGVEVHDGAPILYDCGDFVDDYAVDRELRNDLGFLFEATVEPEACAGPITELRLHPTKIEDKAVHEASAGDADLIRNRMRDRSEALGTTLEEDGGNLVLELH